MSRVSTVPAFQSKPDLNRAVIPVSAVRLIAGWVAIQDGHGWRQGLPYVIGGALGVTLYHASFAFTSAWRSLITDARDHGVYPGVERRYPVGSAGRRRGRAGWDAGRDRGFLFGIGMQLGGRCASGTLFTVGGGSARMVVTFAAFIVGSVIATAHAPWWHDLPGWGSITLGRELGTGPA
jgi:uncharacterized membrane protein YedE/YeeE